MSTLSLDAALKLLKPGTPASVEAVNAWKAVKLFADTLPTYVGKIHLLVACTGVLVTLSVAATLCRGLTSTITTEKKHKSYTLNTALLTITTMITTVMSSLGAFNCARHLNLVPFRVMSCMVEDLNPQSSISMRTMAAWNGLEKIVNKVPLIIKSIEKLSAWTAGCAALALVVSVITIRSQTIQHKNKPSRPLATDRLDEKVIISCLGLAIVTSIGTIAYAKMYTPIH